MSAYHYSEAANELTLRLQANKVRAWFRWVSPTDAGDYYAVMVSGRATKRIRTIVEEFDDELCQRMEVE